MKQVGITLFIMAVLGTIFMIFQLEGVFWETLSLLLVMAASVFIPQFKQILLWKLHWRIALVVAVICTFSIFWQLMERLLGDYEAYSLPATLIVFSLLAFLFHYLDQRDS
jgi:hypothetical protein